MPKEKWVEELFESLAASVKGGFDETEERRSQMEIRVNDRFNLLTNQGELLRADVRDLKRIVSQLVQSRGEDDSEVMELARRISRIERQIGIAA